MKGGMIHGNMLNTRMEQIPVVAHKTVSTDVLQKTYCFSLFLAWKVMLFFCEYLLSVIITWWMKQILFNQKQRLKKLFKVRTIISCSGIFKYFHVILPKLNIEIQNNTYVIILVLLLLVFISLRTSTTELIIEQLFYDEYLIVFCSH